MRIRMAIAGVLLLLGAGAARADVVAKYLGVGNSGEARVWGDAYVDVAFDEVGSPNPAGRELIVYLAIYGQGFAIVGNANVPPDALKGSTSGQVELSVDLASVPQDRVWFQKCVDNPDDPMGNAICGWVHEGTIALRWRTADSMWWDSYKANSTYVWTDWDGTKHVYSGSFAWTMASAEGSVLGFPIAVVADMDGGFATLINSRRIEISIEK